jgi:4-amino-4-deoxy-L-arabinose transferase-like glycosyltransferase
MAHDAQLRLGVPVGTLLVLVAAFGVMDLLGTFDDAASEARPVGFSTTLGALAVPLVTAAVSLLVFALSLMGAASGLLHQWIWGFVVTVAFVGLVYSTFELGVRLGPWATDEAGEPREIWRRHGFWVVIVSALLLFPCMGSFTLMDPWETHYGEVAREILARDDWISLWWAQDGWFWSKPVLCFWLQALFMATLGVDYRPDQMLRGAFGAEAHPEWIVRAPIVLLAVLAVYILYKGVAKVFGRRAALLGGLVLATMPDWWFLAHQTMTDMTFVAPATCTMGLMLFGLYTPEDERVRLYEVRVSSRTVLRLSAWHLVFGAVLVCALPQIFYLVSRNLALILHGDGPYGFRARYDEFRSGSGLGNCGLPGNEPCAAGTVSLIPTSLRGELHGIEPVLRFFASYEPTLQALTWAIVLGLVVSLNAGERRVRRLAYLGGWFFAAIATMGKGPIGFGLPVLCGLFYVATTRRWTELVRFELASGLAILAAVALPWGVAMFVRHGQAFTARLITHDMFDRAFSHVHDTNEGDDTSFRFYIWQLGYALFPWTGLAPVGLLYAMRRPLGVDDRRGEASILLLMWFVVGFAVFSFMGTKFHHYIFPAVPPVAMLLGVTLDELLAGGPVFARAPSTKAGGAQSHVQRMFSAAALGGALILGVIGRDLVWKPEGADSGAIRLVHLVTYNYRRPWPDSVDFSTALTAFTLAGVALGLLLAVERIRKYVGVAFLAYSMVWAVWGLDVYIPTIAPHWGQHEILARYYADRESADEPFVAYQMNWKGENFYTGNRVPVFVSSGGPFSKWLKEQREKGTRVAYFVTEHGRTQALKNEVGGKEWRELTDKSQNNKFVLLRAQL